MKKIIIAITFLFLAFTGIQAFMVLQKPSSVSQKINNKLQVVVSFYPMYFFSSQIGGDKADVFNITPASTEPHDYELTTQDVARITTSNMLVLNGGKLEAWGDKVKDQLKASDVVIITAGGDLANKQLNENGQAIQDPHIWQDPVLAKQEVINIEKGFERIDPKDSKYFQANARILENKLEQLDADFKLGLSTCQKKDFVTSHAAFGYLAAQYGVNQVAISGVSPDEEPSSQKLAEIADLVKKENIKIIFFESLVPPKLSETIAQETGAKTMVLDPIEGISDDDMKAEHTYFTIMKNNLSALRTALGCNK